MFTYFKKHKIQELPLWHNGIGGLLGMLGFGFDPWPGTVGWRSSLAIAAGLGRDCGSDPIPDPGIPLCCRDKQKEGLTSTTKLLNLRNQNRGKYLEITYLVSFSELLKLKNSKPIKKRA